MEECARLGYSELLEEAMASGAAIDSLVLEAALLGEYWALSWSLFRRLEPLLRSNPDGQQQLRYCEMIATIKGQEELMLALKNDLSDNANAALLFFEFGHEALGFKYLEIDHPEHDYIEAIYRAAKGGHLDIAKRICALDGGTSYDSFDLQQLVLERRSETL